MTRIELDDGKYTVVHDSGAGLHALRYGEHWRDMTGDGLVLAMAQEIEDLRRRIVPVQQVSVPASAFASRAITHYEAALLAAFPSGSSGEVFNQWNEARRVLAAAPSPAGVDGCKCSMSISMLGDGCRHCQPQEYIDRLGEMLDEERSELSDAQAIIDGLRGEVAAQRIKTCTALKERNDAREERDAAATECERLRMQLAACGVVALSNTIESAGKARQMHPDYMSASCSDVAGAVDREIALRTERDHQAQRIGELEGLLREVRDTYRAAIHWEDLRGTMKRIDAALSAGKDSVS